jgi:hypothetical protein
MKKFLILLTVIFAAAACSKKKSNPAATAPATTSYYSSNGVCYDQTTNASVATTNCSSLTYTITNGRCYQISNNAQVDLGQCTSRTYYYSNGACYDRNYANVTSTYCTSGGNTTSGYEIRGNYCYDKSTNQQVDYSLCYSGNQGQACYGQYYWIDYRGQTWVVQCNGADCAGWGLFRYPSWESVSCK